MAASQSVSLRIPQELLEQLDAIATEKYPLRKGDTPNRSRMILDFIQKGVESNIFHDNTSDERLTAPRTMSRTVSNNSFTMSDSDIEELIKQQVAQQVQIQVQIQQQVRQQLEQTYSSSLDPALEIAELRREVAEVKKF